MLDATIQKLQPSFSYGYTPLWTAPEVLIGDYDAKVDCWSLGCVIIEMASAKSPWSECSFQNPFAALYHIGNTNGLLCFFLFVLCVFLCLMQNWANYKKKN